MVTCRMANHTATALACNTSQKSQLQRLESSGKTPQKIALRARIILKAIAGESNSAIAKGLHISRPTVLLWRNHFTQAGVPGRARKRASSSTCCILSNLHTSMAPLIVIVPL